MAMQMITVKLDPKHANLESARQKLNLSLSDIDLEFGLVNIDPQQNLYTLMVDEKACGKLAGQKDVKGPFSNPRIETFGPPE
jgi:hypothetical protein